MKKFYLLTKTLLVAALLMIGANAWAETTKLDPTAVTRLHAGEADATHYDGEASSWTCTISSQTGKKFKDDNAKWGGSYVVISKFDASSVLSGKTLTGAKLKFHSQCTVAGKNSQVRVWSIGTDWTASTATWNNTNTDEIINGSIINTTASVTTAGTDIELDVTDLLDDDVDKIIGFGFSTVTGREQEISKLSLEVSYSSEVLYKATFTESNDLNPTVKIYSDAERTSEVLNGTLADATTYYYRATYEGYSDYDGSFTVASANPAVNFTMTLKPRYTFTVNAVNSVGGAVIKTFYTDEESYDGKTQNVSFPAYLTGVDNVVTYAKDDATYYQSYTSASDEATKTVSYTAYAGEAYFFEGEDVAGATIYTTNTFKPRTSSGATGVLNAATVISLEAGVYRVSARAIGKAGNTVSMYKTSTEGEKIFDITTSTTGAIGSDVIVLDETTAIVANGGYYTTSDNGFGFDYILIEKNPTVPATITSAGYATFSSAYAVSIPDGVEAYAVKYTGGNTVSLNKVDAVPANTGVVLKAAEGVYDLPVVASAAAIANNNLLVSDGAVEGNASTIYVLNKKNENVGFYKLDNGVKLEAGKAYLEIPANSEARGFIGFEGATGVNEVNVNKAAVAKNGKIYNLNGQIVSKPSKGLFIVDGKVVSF